MVKELSETAVVVSL